MTTLPWLKKVLLALTAVLKGSNTINIGKYALTIKKNSIHTKFTYASAMEAFAEFELGKTDFTVGNTEVIVVDTSLPTV